jgi:hypothetical protein
MSQEGVLTPSGGAAISTITGHPDTLWLPVSTKTLNKKERGSLSKVLGEMFEQAKVDIGRRPVVLSHLPRHVFEDVPALYHHDVALEMILVGLKVYQHDLFREAISEMASTDHLSPYRPVEREGKAEAREAIAASARQDRLNDQADPHPNVDRQLFDIRPSVPKVAFRTVDVPVQNPPLTSQNLSHFDPSTSELPKSSELPKKNKKKSHHSDSSSDSTVDSEAGFDDPRVLLEPKRWLSVVERIRRPSEISIGICET